MQSASQAFELNKEAAARDRAKEIAASGAKFKDKLKEKPKEAMPGNLPSIQDEAAFHLGNAFYCESRLQTVIKDEDLVNELHVIAKASRERHEVLMAMAGALLGGIKQAG